MLNNAALRARFPLLKPRHYAVLMCVLSGWSLRDTCEEVGISRVSLSHYLKDLRRALGIPHTARALSVDTWNYYLLRDYIDAVLPVKHELIDTIIEEKQKPKCG